MKIHVFVRLADSCRIETYILSENDEHFEEIWDDLRLKGWRFSNTREF